MRRRRPPLASLLTASALAIVAGCASSDDASPATLAPEVAERVSSSCGQSTAPAATYDHVVVIVEENRTWGGGRSPAVGMGFSGGDMPYLADLATQCAYYTEWNEVDSTENSLNQYVGLTAGTVDSSIGSDCRPSDTCRSLDDNIFRQVRVAGGTARTFVDGASEPCSVGDNRPKHVPALYFMGGDDPAHCVEEVRPFSEFDVDRLPNFAFVVPDLCHDGHDCGDDEVDSWAQDTIDPILRSDTYAMGRTLIVVIYDEDAPVPNLLIAPSAPSGPIENTTGSHAALLRTMEEALGLPLVDSPAVREAVSLRPSANI